MPGVSPDCLPSSSFPTCHSLLPRTSSSEVAADKFEVRPHKKSHKNSDILLAGFVSGSLAGFLTNGLETLAVKKQTNSTFNIRKYLSQPGIMQRIVLKGSGYRTFYYGTQACLLFLMLEHLKEYLHVETMED